MRVRVLTAEGMRAWEAACLAAGTPAATLMRRAGEAAARRILATVPEVRRAGALVVAGRGNNGGDAWVVAESLAAAGCPVEVRALGEPNAEVAREAAARARVALATAVPPSGVPAVVVDGLLGLGVAGPPRAEVAAAIEEIRGLAARGAVVVALDLPSGIDATTGAGAPVVRADRTLTFGALKWGLLLRRDEAGAIEVLDIGLDEALLAPTAPVLVDGAWVHGQVPALPADAHKGVRRRLVVVGGAEGMAGAAVWVSRGAHRSGIGMTRLAVGAASVPVVQTLVPQATAARWPMTEEELEPLVAWAHAMVVGPGLGEGSKSRALVERLLVRWRGPVVLDADALNVFAGEPRTLGSLLAGRPAVVTPHPAEAARLLRCEVDTVLADREGSARELARTLGATVLLKGPPTVIADGAGAVAVSASGAPTLGTAGSGDLLAGIVGTLLAQTLDASHAAQVAAWVHGRAGERAASAVSTRGADLDDVVTALGLVWGERASPPPGDVLTMLSAVGRTP